MYNTMVYSSKVSFYALADKFTNISIVKNKTYINLHGFLLKDCCYQLYLTYQITTGQITKSHFPNKEIFI